MLLTQEQVVKKEIKSVAEVAKALNISASAIYTACNNDKIDYCELSGHRFIVFTKTTKAYKPNESPRRVKAVAKSKKQAASSNVHKKRNIK